MLISKTAPENPKKKDAMLRELDKAVGFRKVFEKISDSVASKTASNYLFVSVV